MRPWLLMACVVTPVVSAQDHAAHHATAMPPSEGSAAAASAVLRHEHGGMRTGLVIGERFEVLPDTDLRVWEGQAWYGTDTSRLWVKTEGEYDDAAGTLHRGELQLLHSRPVAPYWDLQAGVRIDDGEGPRRTYATVGLMGLAPYWFEVDLAAFLGERGGLGARLELEYELRFTQRLILQPRVELNLALDDDPAIEVGSGAHDASWGMRLRYEWRREFAPYVGVERQAAFGDTARWRHARGQPTMETSWVMGVRFWY